MSVDFGSFVFRICFIATLVYLLEVPPRIEVPLGKIADFKRVKMVNLYTYKTLSVCVCVCLSDFARLPIVDIVDILNIQCK